MPTPDVKADADHAKGKARTRYLVNPKFQLRWTGALALVGGFIAALFVFLMWGVLDEQAALLNESIAANQKAREADEKIALLLTNMPETSRKEAKNIWDNAETEAGGHSTQMRIQADMLSRNHRGRVYLVGLVFFLTGALFVLGILVTHRVAGPLYVMKAQLTNWRVNRKIEPRNLREGDEFEDVYDELRLALGDQPPPVK